MTVVKMGFISTTRHVMYGLAAVITTGCIGFTVNAYILYLLRVTFQMSISKTLPQLQVCSVKHRS